MRENPRSSFARRHRLRATALSCAAIAVAVLAQVVAAAGAAGSAPATAIPPGARAQLLGLAQRTAERNGDPHPYDVQAVLTSVGKAERVVGQGIAHTAPGSGDPALYVVALRGHFTCGICSGPRGAPTPRGSVITLEIPVGSTADLAAGFGLTDRYPPLRRVGAPVALSGASVRDEAIRRFAKDACDEPLPGEPAPPCAAPAPGGYGATHLRVWTRHRAHALVWALGALQSTGTPSVEATVEYAIYLDGRSVATHRLTLAGGQSLQAPIQLPVALPAGHHTIAFAVTSVEFSSREPGEVAVGPVSLVALSLP